MSFIFSRWFRWKRSSQVLVLQWRSAKLADVRRSVVRACQVVSKVCCKVLTLHLQTIWKQIPIVANCFQLRDAADAHIWSNLRLSKENFHLDEAWSSNKLSPVSNLYFPYNCYGLCWISQMRVRVTLQRTWVRSQCCRSTLDVGKVTWCKRRVSTQSF